MKKVGIIGSGAVGKSLAKGFIDLGFDTTIASRSSAKREQLEKEFNGRIKTDSFQNTAKNSGIIVFAVKGSQAIDALKLAGIENFSAKTIIDTTNPISNTPPVNGVLQ